MAEPGLGLRKPSSASHTAPLHQQNLSLALKEPLSNEETPDSKPRGSKRHSFKALKISREERETDWRRRKHSGQALKDRKQDLTAGRME